MSFQQPEKTKSPQPSDSEAAVILRANELLAQVDRSEEPLASAWDQTLKAKRFGSQVLATAFSLLHEQKQHNSVVEGLQAAIRNDQAQPWMYDVLALEMKLAERPQKEIDRVLLSRIDFAAGNEAQLLVTASMMARFDALDQALLICREAAKINPWQPATWGLSRRIADRMQDPDAIIWSRVGTMKYVWNDDHEAIHAAAETELRDLESSLLKSGQPAMASQVRNAIQDGKTRDLRIRLLWTGNADLDLSVVEPGDSVCSYKARLTSNGGMLIRQGEGGRGEAASGRQTEEYVCVVARSGEYQVRVRYISGRVINGKAIVQVIRHENTDRQQKQSVTLEVGERDAEVSVPLTRGRAADPKD